LAKSARFSTSKIEQRGYSNRVNEQPSNLAAMPALTWPASA